MKSPSWTCGFDIVDAMREESKAAETLSVWGRCLLFREVKGPSKVEKEQQNTGEELIMNCHISRTEFQELGD